MSLQESYGFDAFCQELVQTWPTISLSFRRAKNRLFVTASSLGTLATAIGHNDELAGSTVRRAVADLHARLVVRGPLANLQEVGRHPIAGEDQEVFTLVKRVQNLNEQIEAVEEEIETFNDALNRYVEDRLPTDFEAAVAAGAALPELHRKSADLSNELEEVEEKLNELDPDRIVESRLIESGCL